MVLEKVKTILAEQFDVEEDTITEDTSLQEDLGADSLDVVEMIMTLEEQFGITIPEEDAIAIKTVEDIVKIIDAK